MSEVAEADTIRELRSFEEALPGPLFERLAHAVRDVGDERLKVNYDTTFWYPRDRAPTNVVEEAITRLVELVCPPRTCIGTEWWLGRLRYGEKLPFHFDRDKSLKRVTGQYVAPLYASILYLNTFPGSPTIVLGQVAGPDGKSKIPEKPRFREPVHAVRNRYVVFAGGLRHGVKPDVDSSNVGHAGQRDEVRLTLLVNYWHRRPSSPICTDYDGSTYAPLGSGGGERAIAGPALEHPA